MLFPVGSQGDGSTTDIVRSLAVTQSRTIDEDCWVAHLKSKRQGSTAI